MKYKLPPDISRRRFIVSSSICGLGILNTRVVADDYNQNPTGFNSQSRELVNFPGKRPLYKVHTRPPHLETPFDVFNEEILTPNDAFFVRYHLSSIPLSIDASNYRLRIRGAVNVSMQFSLSDLKSLGDVVEVVAVNQCAGNSRGFFSPRVFGAQVGHGDMGNARWAGIPLRTVLLRAGVLPQAKQVVFNGMDEPILPETPDFRKSLSIEHALSSEPLLAWSMNGQDLPMLNGYPLRLVVPGFYGTYWVKHLMDIEVIDNEFTGKDAFYMHSAYRLPDNDCFCSTPDSESMTKTRPITTLTVRSFITNIKPGDTIPLFKVVLLRGIAFDKGQGIKKVEISMDAGRNWLAANLGDDLGRYSFRTWSLKVSFEKKGPLNLMVRATNLLGETQSTSSDWNPGGYRRHVIEVTPITVL